MNKNKSVSLEDQAIKSEILWSLNVAQKGFSYSSGEELDELFSSMFTDFLIATKLSMQADTISYVVSYGLGPYVKKS